MSRLSLSPADRMARNWFVETTKSLGCNVSVDSMGNTFAIRKGRREGTPTCAGSHLDTQPTGGRYDGILGVCAGVEMLRVLQEQKIETEYPVGVINWTNEEGARFPISMIASGVWAGKIPLERAHSLQEVAGGKQTMKQELKRIGFLGDMETTYKAMRIGAHFELHIEQGPRLEAQSQKIGIVHGVQAYRWHTVTVKGRDCHTGTTDFANRSDAMLTAAKLIVHSHRLATKHSCLASTGILTLTPGSTNTVPGTVQFSLDIRAGEDDRLMRLENQLQTDFEKIASNEPVDDLNEGGTIGKGCSVYWSLDAPSEAINFDEDCIRCVENSTRDLFGDEQGKLSQAMISGAGHDSVFTSKRVPTSMIFVPCKDGVSHNPEEYCSPEDCANGAQVLMGAVLRYDKFRGEKAKN
jgi:hydantoinase/carbamoylase family amidase